MNELMNMDNVLMEVQNTQKMCQALLQSPHYKKMGSEGVYAIVEKAKSLGMSPIEALNGGLYFVQGKVEMTSATMNGLIRDRQHSITKDRNSNEEICILHGKRKDNGDTWVESFSIDDAKRAGIYRNQWLKYPKDMLFARALSRLARQLFPDVIKGCYVQGEIADAPSFNSPVDPMDYFIPTIEPLAIEKKELELIDEEQYHNLISQIGNKEVLKKNIIDFMQKRYGIDDLTMMPVELYSLALKRAEKYTQDQEMAVNE